jgi:signal transduction histidine kinase
MNKLKKEFVQIISHQIRSPLTIIKWQIEILQQSGEKGFTKKQRQYIDKIYEENERITTMVNEILNMARAEKHSESANVSETVLEETISECIKILDSFAKLKKINIIFENDAQRHTVLVDSEKLKIAFVNLIENAISYSKKESDVVIKIKKIGKDVEIMIKDHGIGIKKDEHDLIFQKFYRGSGGRKFQPEGTGLGLYMTKMVVDQMEGMLRFKSKVNKGTEFYLTLPLTRVI